MAIGEQITGAADWRSDSEKEKSLLRKAVASLFKTWIPDHPEASMERGELFNLFRDAMGTAPGRTLTLVSQLSSGVEDIFGYEFHDQQLSMQELLVQREGTDAFLDPKNALRVVRRKFSMMTLIGRMASTFEQRNIIAVTLRSGIDQEKLLAFGRLMAARVEGTSAEEEQNFRKAFRRGGFGDFVDVLYHTQVVGRRLPVPWMVKQAYSRLGREVRAGALPETAAASYAQTEIPRLSPKDLKQFLLYTEDLVAELDAGGFDPAAVFIRAAEERPLLTATRSIFDDFKEERRLRMHERALGAPENTQAEVERGLEEGFVDAAEEDGQADEEDELLRMAKALERVRDIRGKEFFSRISMVSGDVSFVADAQGGGFENLEKTVTQLDPLEGLKQAREVTEPFYRARALAAVVPLLKAGGKEAQAAEAARESLASARKCHTGEVDQAYTAALGALIAVGDLAGAQEAVAEALRKAHEHTAVDERVAALMRVCGTLMEAGALPPEVKSSLSREVLGGDIHFWGKKEVTPALVEVILSLLSAVDDDTMIFLQKVGAHANEEVRRSVIRTMPLSESEQIRNLLLSHLKDKETGVRVEVIERIGWTGDRKLGLYLANHVRHGGATTAREKRAIALNLARLDAERFLPLYNAMLGSLHTQGAPLTGNKAFKDDDDLQMAALQVLYHLNSRDARRLLFNAQKRAKGAMKDVTETLFLAVKSLPYGDPTLPRSPHDPQWSEEDEVDALQLVEQLRETLPATEAAPLPPEPEATPAADDKAARRQTGGLFSRLKSKLFGGGKEETDATEEAPLAYEHRSEQPPAAPGEPAAHESAPDALPSPAEPTEPPIYDGPTRAALRFEAMLLEGEHPWSGSLPMTFRLYVDEASPQAMWREDQPEVAITEGSFEVLLGIERRLPDTLPSVVWLGVTLPGEPELSPRTRLTRARSVVQG